MIKVKLPVFESHIDETNKKLVVDDKEIEVAIDTSLFAEERWEANFPHNAKNETLFAYIERLKNDGALDPAHVMSHLKALYCFIESDAIVDFKSFCQLFAITDAKRLARLVEKIKGVFEIIIDSATTDSKN